MTNPIMNGLLNAKPAPKKETKSKIALYQMEYNFAQYLAYTLGPDVKAAGNEETAKDIRKAAVLIEKLVMELRHYRGAK